MATLTTSVPLEINLDPDKTPTAPVTAVTMRLPSELVARVRPLARATHTARATTISAPVVTTALAMTRMILATLA